MVCQGSSLYNSPETKSKLDERHKKQTGASLCSQFHGISIECAQACETCPHWCKINSPVALGYEKGTRGNGDAQHCSTQQRTGDADADAEIERLARLNDLEYDRQREAAAKKLGVRMSILDKLVATQRQTMGLVKKEEDPSAEYFKSPELWPSPVDGVQLLMDTITGIKKYAKLKADADYLAAALWTAHTHIVHSLLRYTPRLAALSPDYECGKSTLMRTLAHLAPRPQLATSVSTASFFRNVHNYKPTVLLEELDQKFSSSADASDFNACLK